MRKKLNSFLLIFLCFLFSCQSVANVSDNKQMLFPAVDNVVYAKSKSKPIDRFIISKDDFDIDVIKPTQEKIVKYNTPRQERVISQDFDNEISNSFWNMSIYAENDEPDFISNKIIVAVKNKKLEEQNAKQAQEKTVVAKQEKIIEPIKTEKVDKPQQKIEPKIVTEKQFEKEALPKNETNKKIVEKPKQTQSKKQEFVPVRKIDEESLDMTNLKNLKVKEMPLIQQTGTSGDKLILAIPESQWIIKDINPPYLDLADRKNTDKNTIFTFNVKSFGEVDLIFVRTTKEAIIRQPYKITIKETAKKSETKQVPDQNVTDAYKKGMQAKKQGKTDQARKLFEQALSESENPYFTDALTELINIYKNDNDYENAEKIYKKYTTDETRASSDKLNILNCDFFVLNKDYKNAINSYRQFLSDYPDSNLLDKALFYLAYSLENYKVNPNYKEAYRIYNIIVEQYPESKYHKASLNRSLYLERHYLKIN